MQQQTSLFSTHTWVPAYKRWYDYNTNNTTRFESPLSISQNTIKGTTKVNSQYKSCLILIFNKNMEIIGRTKSDSNGVYYINSDLTENYVLAVPPNSIACPKISGALDANYVEPEWDSIKTENQTGDSILVDLDGGSIPTYDDIVLNLNPDHYYRLNETSGTTIVDEIGSSDGTLTGTLTSVSALPVNSDAGESALEFDGATRIDFGQLTQPQYGSSASLLFKPASLSGYQCLLNDTINDVWIGLNGNRISVYYDGTNHYTDTTLTVASVYHVAFIAYTNKIRVYLNGSLDGEFSVQAQIPLETLGNNADPATSEYFDGVIDNFAYWNRILSDSEIQKLWANSGL